MSDTNPSKKQRTKFRRYFWARTIILVGILLSLIAKLLQYLSGNSSFVG